MVEVNIKYTKNKPQVTRAPPAGHKMHMPQKVSAQNITNQKKAYTPLVHSISNFNNKFLL